MTVGFRKTNGPRRRRSDDRLLRVYGFDVAISALLFITTLLLYSRVAHFDFVDFDDDGYVAQNHYVQQGITPRGIAWAMTTGAQSNWHPLTWLSHMTDVQLLGKRPGPMHLENALLHALNAVLLFIALLMLTGMRWPSAWAAALFAWHPLHVESVAWISERKDVLSTLLLFCCLISYANFSRKPTLTRQIILISTFILGLMAKPMIVTLPCLLLLLDYWPLKRLSRRSVLEKMPLFAVAVLSAIITFNVQSTGRSVANISSLPLLLRLENVILSYGRYVKMTFWPTGLIYFYPHASTWPGGTIALWAVALSALMLIGVTALAWRSRSNAPWLIVGWLWFVGTLVPVIGLVQVGRQALADRYTYVPIVGLFIAIAWAGAAIARRSPKFIAIAAIVIPMPLVMLTFRQIGFWRNSETLARHALEVMPDNYLAHATLGRAMQDRGDNAAAEIEYDRALTLNPNEVNALYNLATLRQQQGRDEEALALYAREISADPSYAPAYNNLGNLLTARGDTRAAISAYRAGIDRANEPLPQLHHNLALALAGQQQFKEAIEQWRRALKLDPDYIDAQFRLGEALAMTGKLREGVDLMQRASALAPGRAEILTSLAWALATAPGSPEPARAVELARRACELSNESDPAAIDALGAALARLGDFDQAVQQATRAAQLADQQNNSDFAAKIRSRIERYKAHQPFISGQ